MMTRSSKVMAIQRGARSAWVQQVLMLAAIGTVAGCAQLPPVGIAGSAPSARAGDEGTAPPLRRGILGSGTVTCDGQCDVSIKVGPDTRPEFRGDCLVTWDKDRILVKKGKTARVVWRLEKRELTDVDTYEFDDTVGIQLNPYFKNDPAQDVALRTHVGGDGRTFEMAIPNARPRDNHNENWKLPKKGEVKTHGVRFDFTVYRVRDGAPCNREDPVVINKGQ